MRGSRFYILCATLPIFVISACAPVSRLDKDHGRSFKEARNNQVLYPEARKSLEPVSGLDGHAAQAGIEKYRKTFEQRQETPQPIFQPGTQLK